MFTIPHLDSLSLLTVPNIDILILEKSKPLVNFLLKIIYYNSKDPNDYNIIFYIKYYNLTLISNTILFIAN